ncbi:MAG: helix-turn-helix transcriptional regulator, partial [Mycobacteriales bacterium]
AESGPPLAGPLELAAYAAVLRAAGDEHWDRPLREVLATAGESATAWPLAADLIAGLRARLRSDLAAEAADAWARRAADAAAYGWEMVFRTEALWAHLHTDGTTERTAAIGTALARHDLPETAGPLLASARALAVADRGDLARARALAGADSATCLGRWLGAELALLDGDETSAQALAGGLLVDLADDDPALPLTVLTAAWAGTPTTDRAHLPSPLQLTLLALETGAWAAAAGAWNGALRRERVRALLAEAGGDTGGTAPTGAAVGILQDAERIATEGGLAVLAGRARRELRRRGALVDQPERPAPGADEHGLSGREREVIDLVAQGQSSRRIAERLGLTSHTVESYVKSAMQKLGARTRTEATVLARRTR